MFRYSFPQNVFKTNVKYFHRNNFVTVCIPGYCEIGYTCHQCLSFISGSGGEMLIDDDTNTCSAVPIPKIEGAVPTYQLRINGNCASYHNLKVTIGNSVKCGDLRSVLFVEKLRPGCNDINNHFNVCDVTEEGESNGQKLCFMRCKCAESANQSVLHIVSGIIMKPMSICEIEKY